MKNKLSLSLLLILSITFFSNSFSAIFTWTGTASTAWNDAQNWTNNSVPTSVDDILININSVNDLILDQDKVIGNIQLLSSSSRKIVLGNYNLTANSLTGYSSTCYVKTSGNGKLSLIVNNGVEVIFPVGNSTYDRVKIKNNTGSSDLFSVRVMDAVYINGYNGAIVSTPVVNRTWDISKTNSNSSPGVNLTFEWGDVNKIINGVINNPRLNHHNGVSWEIANINTWTGGSNPILHTVTGYTGTFSPFTISEGSSPLPVELTSFNANCTENATTINWQTASEHNSAYFDIEKSRDGSTWNVIKTVNAAGNSTSTIDYSIEDAEKTTGVVYYRLNQIDQDGESKIYGPISANCGETTDFTATVFPNPASGMVTVEMNNPIAQSVSIQICGTDGKVIEQIANTLEEGTTQIPLSIATLKAGVYTVKVNGENTLKTIKLIVQ
jgi:hypothetical protein